MRAFQPIALLVMVIAVGSALAQPSLTPKRVSDIYRDQPGSAAKVLAEEYKAYVNDTYKALAATGTEDELIKNGLKEHDEIFHQLISLAVEQKKDPEVARLSAAWALNGKAIAAQVIANRNRKKTGSNYVTLEHVRGKLPDRSELIEMVRYRRFDFAQNTFSKEKRYATWVISPDKSAKVVLVDLDDSRIDKLVDNFNTQIKETERIIDKEKIAWLKAISRNKDLGYDGYVKKWNQALEAIRIATIDEIDKAAEGRIYKASRWILGPAADLWLVPFSALPLKDKNDKDANGVKYAIEKYYITYVVTGRELVDFGVKPPDNRQNTLILAGPDFGQETAKAVPRRPHGESPTRIGQRSVSDAQLPMWTEAEVIGEVEAQAKDIVVIEMVNYEFQPKNVTIDVGKIKTIRFLGKQGTHTATSYMKGKDGQLLFDSGKIKKDGKFEIDVVKLFQEAGGKPVKLEYYCKPHENEMKGTIELVKVQNEKKETKGKTSGNSGKIFPMRHATQYVSMQYPLELNSYPHCACALIVVRCLPTQRVFFDGLPTNSIGSLRQYSTPPLAINQQHSYEIKAEVSAQDKSISTVKKTIFVRGGQIAHVDLTQGPTQQTPGFSSGFLTDECPFRDIKQLAEMGDILAKKTQAEFILKGNEASESAFFDKYPRAGQEPIGPQTLVFCTHGFFRGMTPKNNPLAMCGLALAGANRNCEKGNRSISQEVQHYDGLLTGVEIADRNLQGVDLVVTIACQTSQGYIVRGVDGVDGGSIASLRHAFRLAGARTVVATLWPIHFETGQVVIVGDPKAKDVGFFDNLLMPKSGDKSNALHRAQQVAIDYLRTSQKDVAHPYYWASFSLTGDWGILSEVDIRNGK